MLVVPVPPVLVSRQCLPPGPPLVAIPVFFVGSYVLVCMGAGGGVAPSSDPPSLVTPPPRFLACMGLGGGRPGFRWRACPYAHPDGPVTAAGIIHMHGTVS